ncbi:MAG TPA: hypothetical protein VFC21_08805 [Bryobacteraceae bacterium]|nr:hypothetical protein [Bryobacteraceae bacterium]
MSSPRALAPASRSLELFGPALNKGAKALLYKGPEPEAEMAEAAREADKLRARMHIAARFELPHGMGSRTIVEIVG